MYPNLPPPPNLFSVVLRLLDFGHCCKLSLYAFSRKAKEPNLRKWQKPNFGPNFGSVGPNLGPKNFFRRFYLYYMLKTLYHCIKFQVKLMIQTQEKPHFGHNLGPFSPNLGRQTFYLKICLPQSLDIMVSYHHV